MLTDLKNQRVVLGLSGGVDSAVAAILLQDAGADVHALHMTNWEDEDSFVFEASSESPESSALTARRHDTLAFVS